MIKPIAIYLPQFHPIPENDKAWGEGFTEWTNVKKAKPLFDGHYQPHVPHEDVGYYDLRDPEVMVRQAAMAKEYGIYGFAFYHYWFNGKRLLETPLDNMLKEGKPDFPFLYIWANEHWSRRWDGSDHEIIQEQHYSHEDDLNHIRFLCANVFSDKRYITIDDKPVFMVYRTELLPDIKETAKIWREEAKKNGFKDLYLIRVENFEAGINPLEIGFDAAMEFAPDWRSVQYDETIISEDQNSIHNYISLVKSMIYKKTPEFPWYRCIFPSWDNSARKNRNAGMFVGNSSAMFHNFILYMTQYTRSHFTEDKQLLFINAWNEWGEGCHLEPDNNNGYDYLECVERIVNSPKSVLKVNSELFFVDLLVDEVQQSIILNEKNKIFEQKTSSKPYKLADFILNIYRTIRKKYQ